MDLLKIRKSKGFSQIQMAALIGVSINTYINWERGVMKPNPENAEKIKKLLNRER